jgi:isoaspartyl peptidase/L-asparaginase-like protein (Ntn-hydrolase superfamily)
MGVQRFALDDANLYWTSAMDHAVKSVEKKKGGTVTVLASSQDGPFAIAVDASGVYWSNTGDGTVNALRR